jgi:hypothetical protein
MNSGGTLPFGSSHVIMPFGECVHIQFNISDYHEVSAIITCAIHCSVNDIMFWLFK